MPKIVGKLTAGDADGILMQAAALFDSTFNKNQAELNQLFSQGGGGGGGSTTPITQDEYDALAEYENKWYIIKDSDDNLSRIYFGSTLIARKAGAGESASSVFPCVLPFIFS